jgi:hypothetical protein
VQRDSFNVVMIKSLRTEINLRVTIHFALILTKYIASAIVILGIVLWGPPQASPALGLLVAAIFGFLIDIVILENLGWVRTAGSFQKCNLENSDLLIVKWESKVAQSGNAWTCFTVPGYLLGTWSVGPLLFFSAFFLQFSTARSLNVVAVTATSYFMTYSFYLVFRHLGKRSVESTTNGESPIVA